MTLIDELTGWKNEMNRTVLPHRAGDADDKLEPGTENVDNDPREEKSVET